MQNYECKSDSLTEETCTCSGTLCKREWHLIRESPGRFYRSELYNLMSEGVSDMHCMSDEFLVRKLEEESWNTK